MGIYGSANHFSLPFSWVAGLDIVRYCECSDAAVGHFEVRACKSA